MTTPETYTKRCAECGKLMTLQVKRGLPRKYHDACGIIVKRRRVRDRQRREREYNRATKAAMAAPRAQRDRLLRAAQTIYEERP